MQRLVPTNTAPRRVLGLAASASLGILGLGCEAPRESGPGNGTAETSLSASITIDNNSVWRDTDGQNIKAQGGGIIQVGAVYHWFGPDFGGTGDYKFYAINRYTSRDLKNWTKQTPALTPGMPGLPFGAGSWVGRPWVMWNPNDSRFVMAVEWGGGGEIRNQYAFLSATSIEGPWTYHSDKLIKRLPDRENVAYNLGDMGVYSEGGSAWLLYTFDKPEPNYAQAILKLGPDFMTPLPPVAPNYVEFSGGKWMAGVQEAAAVFKRNGTYYYFTSLCNGWKSSPTRYRTATSMAGPWTANAIVPTNPSSGDSFNTQHDFVLPITGTTDTTYVFFGDRWNNFRASTGAADVGLYAWYPLSFGSTGVPTINAPNYAANGGDWQLEVGDGSAEPPDPTDTQLENADFEADLQHWTVSGNASIATSAAEVHGGAKALKAWSRAPYTTVARNASANAVAAGSYSLSVWSRAGGTFTRRALEVYVDGQKAAELALPASSAWTSYSVDAIAVPDGARIEIGVALNAEGGAWTQFDDFALERR